MAHEYTVDGKSFYPTQAAILQDFKVNKKQQSEFARSRSKSPTPASLPNDIEPIPNCKECDRNSALFRCIALECNQSYCDRCWGAVHCIPTFMLHQKYPWNHLGTDKTHELVDSTATEKDAAVPGVTWDDVIIKPIEQKPLRTKLRQSRPKYEVGNVVIFQVTDRPMKEAEEIASGKAHAGSKAKGQLGRIAQRPTRSGNTWFYRVEYRQPGNGLTADGKRLEDVYDEDEEDDGCRGTGRLCMQMCSEKEIETPLEARERCMMWALDKLLLAFISNAMRKWHKVTVQCRDGEALTKAVVRIQRTWRGHEGRVASVMMKEMRRQEILLKKLAQERIEREAAEAWRKAEELRIQRERGLTIDGIRFFRTKKELEDFFLLMNSASERVARAVTRMALGKRYLAFSKWRRITVDAVKLEAALNGHLARLPRDELEALDKGTFPPAELGRWHPAIGLRLPTLPVHSTILHSTGTLETKDFTQYNKFRNYIRGPSDTSNWVLKSEKAGALLMGAYPEGQAQLANTRISSRSGTIASILLEGIGTFIALLTPEEIASKPLVFSDAIVDRANLIRDDLKLGVAATLKAKQKTDASLIAAKNYSSVQRKGWEVKAATSNESYNRSCDALKRFPSEEKLKFVTVSIPRGGIASDDVVLDLVRNIEQRYRDGERIYMFSAGGHGRVGVVAALLLGRLFGEPPETVLHRVQRHHDARQERTAPTGPGTKKIDFLPIHCPRTEAQRAQVRRLLAPTQPLYDQWEMRGDIGNLRNRWNKRAEGLPAIINAPIAKRDATRENLRIPEREDALKHFDERVKAAKETRLLAVEWSGMVLEEDESKLLRDLTRSEMHAKKEAQLERARLDERNRLHRERVEIRHQREAARQEALKLLEQERIKSNSDDKSPDKLPAIGGVTGADESVAAKPRKRRRSVKDYKRVGASTSASLVDPLAGSVPATSIAKETDVSEIKAEPRVERITESSLPESKLPKSPIAIATIASETPSASEMPPLETITGAKLITKSDRSLADVGPIDSISHAVDEEEFKNADLEAASSSKEISIKPRPTRSVAGYKATNKLVK